MINRELELKRHGLKLLKRSPSSFTPRLDGRYLLLGSDKEQNYSEISKFSKSDADAYSRFSIYFYTGRYFNFMYSLATLFAAILF